MTGLAKSANIKHLTGTYDKHEEVKGAAGVKLTVMGSVPPPPGSLTTKAGKEIWKKAAGQMVELNMLHGTSIGLIENYCIQYEIILACKKEIDKHGVTIDGGGRKGRVKNPACITMQVATTRFVSLGARFGFTPADAARIATPPDEEEQDADDFKNI